MRRPCTPPDICTERELEGSPYWAPPEMCAPTLPHALPTVCCTRGIAIAIRYHALRRPFEAAAAGMLAPPTPPIMLDKWPPCPMRQCGL